MLLIDGGLEVKGGFTWNGLIIVKGNFTAAAAKNITGAVISGGNYSLDSVSGNTAIIYCNQAISRQTQGLPMVVMKWME